MEKLLSGFTQKALAENLKISPAAVSKWFKRGRIPLERVPDIERLTGISRHELRPDFFGPAPRAHAPRYLLALRLALALMKDKGWREARHIDQIAEALDEQIARANATAPQPAPEISRA